MHHTWHVPELLTGIISSLPASDISQAFQISHHFRNILRSNLSPCLRPLPENTCNKQSRSTTLPQDVRDEAKAFGTQEIALPEQLKMTDIYYYWLEDAQSQVLDKLKTCLHPFLSRHAVQLINGYEALAEGKLSFCLQTVIPFQHLYDFIYGKDRKTRSGFLASKPPTAVTVFCFGGVAWDLSYANVQCREYESGKKPSVRVEKEGGVMMEDIVNELRGTLVVDGMSGGLGQDVVLIWKFDD